MVRRLTIAACAVAALQIGSAAAWRLDLRSGVPEGDIEVLFDVVVSQTLDPANEFAFIDLGHFPTALAGWLYPRSRAGCG